MNQKIGCISIHAGCSLACPFCGGTPKPSPESLRAQELIAQKTLQEFKQRGIMTVDISSGDPIEYQYISELIDYMKKEGFCVQLSTHGAGLADKSLADKIVAAGVDKLRIPIYGSCSKIHDVVVGKKGSFQKTISGIRYVLKKNNKIELLTSTLVLKQNKNDLLKILDLVSELKSNYHSIGVPCLVSRESSYYSSFYVPLKDLPPYIKPTYGYVVRTKANIIFLEIPFCVFGEFNEVIYALGGPPDMGSYWKPDKNQQTEDKDLPAYRKKKKIEMCVSCSYVNYCGGFYVNDIEVFGAGNLHPIKMPIETPG